MLTLDRKTHTYYWDGVKVPGVTGILEAAGIADFSGVRNREESLRRGDGVHLTTYLYDIGDLGSLPLWVEPYLDGWIKFKREVKWISEAREKPIMSQRLWVAGKPDDIGRGEIYDGIKTVLDIKSGELYSCGAIQTAGYETIYNEGKPPKEKARRRLIVRLPGDGTYVLPPPEYYQKTDKSVFLSALTIRNWGVKNGKRTD